MAEKKINNPYQALKKPTLQKKFDTYYEAIKILDKVEKTGEGEEDFIIKKKVVVEKTPIQDVIDADKDSVGVDNIIKQVLRTQDTSLLPVDKGDCDVDLVGAPEDLMQLKQMGVDADQAYKQLPPELTNGLDMKAFVNSLTQEQFDAFIKSMADRLTPKKKDEVKGNE